MWTIANYNNLPYPSLVYYSILPCIMQYLSIQYMSQLLPDISNKEKVRKYYGSLNLGDYHITQKKPSAYCKRLWCLYLLYRPVVTAVLQQQQVDTWVLNSIGRALHLCLCSIGLFSTLLGKCIISERKKTTSCIMQKVVSGCGKALSSRAVSSQVL